MATTNMTENISVDLDQLLTRLSDTLLSPTADDSHIRATPYERNRISANVEYARTLLLRLEHSTQDIKTQTQKTTVQNDLATKRNLIKRFNTRLLELNQLASLHDDEDSSSEDEDEENRPREFAPAVQTSDTIDTDPSLTSPQQAAQDLASTLRNRASAANPSAPADTATTTA
ncbi:hypothetical protein E4T50_09188 [Aureobasidium sp. EXF-12298]|nr:hypothetical protein E4T50_09188 [Aureobasidium sp. EXF-12298]